MKTYTLILFLNLINLVVAGQSGLVDNKLFTPKELQEDYLIFRKALETTYPSLYRFSDTLTINNYLDDQYNRLSNLTTELDFYKIIALACSKANDEHLIPTPSKKILSVFTKYISLLPFFFKNN